MRISDWSSDVCSSDLNGVDAQHQLARLEGLGQVVVGAGLEAGDAVLGLAHGGQQQDRHGAFPAQGFRELQAGLAGHHDVEHQQVEGRSEEHTSELQSLMRISYAVFCLKKKK